MEDNGNCLSIECGWNDRYHDTILLGITYFMGEVVLS